MIQKSPSIQIRMTSLGLWSLEGTPGILEVYNHVDSPPEDQGDDTSSHTRAEVASKLLETLDNFNYDETEESSDAYISDWLTGSEAAVALPSIFEDLASLPPPPPPLVSSTGRQAVCSSGPGGFYGPRGACAAVPTVPVIDKLGYGASPVWNSNKKVGYEATALWTPAGSDDYSTGSLYSPPAAGTQWHLEPVYQGVSNQLTPPHSPPTMYETSPRRPLEFDDLPADLLKSSAAKELYEDLPAESALNSKEENNNGQLIMSLLAEMDQKDIDEIVQCSVEQNFGIAPDSEPNLEASATNYVESLSPEHSCSSSESNFGYHSESDRSSSCSSDPDYNPYSPPEVTRKTPETSRSGGGRKAAKTSEASRSARAIKPYARKAPGRSARAIKPYARKAAVPVEDKKLRKKEQNKNAATRYRIKKKAEIEVILGEESELREKNEELQKSVEDLNREIKFMKKFMRDFFKTQGVLK
nr:activating transcription factor 4 [Bactericera cockerelli]